MKKNYGIMDPAGGIVFYDKGHYSDGWRYIEVAPKETEQEAEWGAFEVKIGGLENTSVWKVGCGKRNTEIIVEYLNKNSETGRAAQICSSLSINGFNDWYLPSADELSILRNNMPTVNMHGRYWSSNEEPDKRRASCGMFSGNSGGSSVSIGFKNNTYLVRAIRYF